MRGPPVARQGTRGRRGRRSRHSVRKELSVTGGSVFARFSDSVVTGVREGIIWFNVVVATTELHLFLLFLLFLRITPIRFVNLLLENKFLRNRIVY